MKNVITEQEAYDMYLKSGLEDIYPFRSYYEYDFIQYLYTQGITVLDAEEVDL